MPAHSQAALAAYPEMGCTGEPYKVMDIWNYSYDNFCAGNDNVFTFIENILDEICELFPSKYIHIGGDECKKDAWNSCPKCQKRIEEEQLADADELQHYFTERVAKYLKTKDRRIIGWDEIAEGGAIPGAAVMLWLQKGASFNDALANGNPIVVSLHQHTYFDYYQGNPETEPLAIGGYLPLSKTYNFEPVPDNFTKDCSLILGTQGQIWSQYMPDPPHLEYMTFPRAAAVAENGWTQKENKDYSLFFDAMEDYLKRLDFLHVNYRVPETPENEWDPEFGQPSVGV
jgi:hexosaminidase